ncbi:MAG: PA0069 family radical SAM protein [Pseudomonadota bacterium]
MSTESNSPIKGRGSASQPDARYLSQTRESIEDGWEKQLEESKLTTSVLPEKAKSIIARNQSPDIPFSQSINPYRGCEHGCIYCYARPAHAYMDLSPGLDFESKLFYKLDAVQLLEKEIAAKNYQCSPIALGSNTDPYQPIERQYQVTRQIIELLKKYKHPLTIVTKSSLVERDIELLADMAQKNLVRVFISITTLDNSLMQKMEPRASSPARRLKTLHRLHEAGISTGVMFAPVIPFINDKEMETILEQAAAAEVKTASYVLLRLPHEIKTLFREWLEIHYPLKAAHVMSLIQQTRGGKDYDASFEQRLIGTGQYAHIIKKRFVTACKRYKINNSEQVKLDCSQFQQPVLRGQQIDLF